MNKVLILKLKKIHSIIEAKQIKLIKSFLKKKFLASLFTLMNKIMKWKSISILLKTIINLNYKIVKK